MVFTVNCNSILHQGVLFHRRKFGFLFGVRQGVKFFFAAGAAESYALAVEDGIEVARDAGVDVATHDGAGCVHDGRSGSGGFARRRIGFAAARETKQANEK